MKVSFSTISCPHYDAREIAAAAGKFGYDGVELYALEGQRLLPEMLEEKAAELQRELAGVPIVSINSWGILSMPDRDERAGQEAKIARTFELAAELGSPLVKTFGGDLPTNPFDDVLSYMTETLSRLARRAESLGVTLIVETHDGFCRGRLLGQLMDRLPQATIGALWDVHHPHRMGEDVAATDAAIGHRVRHVHVKDAVPDGEGWRFVLLGEGELPVRQVIRALAARAYTGHIALDWELMWHPDIAPAEVALPHFIHGLRQIIVEETRVASQVPA